ncbi:hypothetical protein BO71DRAFT_454675 [Aspergillus ellipticus CBS 707.79]|uniref:HRQ family protein 2 n=1 Tax=Aspergillus ellipticus CBS 707.79 TaxID=1448320 RepID=A0A319CPZ0_9EURO|nr:hypothetical protein BO71DRAFT_454675 [Aspergillus ellipticus CBS 707.79]
MDLDSLIRYFQQNPTVVVFLVLALWLFGQWNRPSPQSQSQSQSTPTPKTPTKQPTPTTTTITPLPDFNWETTEPLQFRPFKPKYHLSMALTTTTLSDLIPIDKTYKQRLALRASLLSQHPSVVVGVTPAGEQPGTIVHSAVTELYEFVVGTYLPTRYPSMFVLEDTPSPSSSLSSPRPKTTKSLYNKTTTHGIPTTLTGPSRSALETLGTFVDEDFLVLLPESAIGTNPQTQKGETGTEGDGEGEKYTLEAYTTFFPAGFDTREKLGKRLSTIHAPVPRYKEKLEKSMDRFFARMEVGRVVQRVNWSVTTGTELFAAFGGVHGNEKREEGVMGVGMEGGELTFMRCERQLLHRLPRTKALVFSFHTYTYPIRQIKEEGLGEEMAIAIDGLKEGNVPEIHRYKRGPVWGEAVKAFLRS